MASPGDKPCTPSENGVGLDRRARHGLLCVEPSECLHQKLQHGSRPAGDYVNLIPSMDGEIQRIVDACPAYFRCS